MNHQKLRAMKEIKAFCHPFPQPYAQSRRHALADRALAPQMPELPRFVALAVLFLTLTSCATTERLFTSDPGPEAAAGEGPRPVNIWPIYYQNGTSNSALWP
ncbi:MAG: hypothetical protein ACI88C_002995, partial [Acidimicrobiales bacterium]